MLNDEFPLAHNHCPTGAAPPTRRPVVTRYPNKSRRGKHHAYHNHHSTLRQVTPTFILSRKPQSALQKSLTRLSSGQSDHPTDRRRRGTCGIAQPAKPPPPDSTAPRRTWQNVDLAFECGGAVAGVLRGCRQDHEPHDRA